MLRIITNYYKTKNILFKSSGSLIQTASLLKHAQVVYILI